MSFVGEGGPACAAAVSIAPTEDSVGVSDGGSLKALIESCDRSDGNWVVELTLSGEIDFARSVGFVVRAPP